MVKSKRMHVHTDPTKEWHSIREHLPTASEGREYLTVQTYLRGHSLDRRRHVMVCMLQKACTYNVVGRMRSSPSGMGCSLVPLEGDQEAQYRQ